MGSSPAGSDPRSEPVFVTRWRAAPDQAHIRSPLVAAAPTSRVRRVGLRRPGPFFWSAVEAIGHFGSATWIRQGLIRSLRTGSDRRRRRLHHGPLDDDAGGRVPPQGDKELARQDDDGRLAHPPAKAPDPLVEPQAERRGRLVLQIRSWKGLRPWIRNNGRRTVHEPLNLTLDVEHAHVNRSFTRRS